MIKNTKSLFVIVCLFLSANSCYGSKDASQHSASSNKPALTHQPSLDFMRGDTIPWSVSSLPVRGLKATGDLMFDNYGKEVDGKEIKISKTKTNSIEYWNKLAEYINVFTQHVNEVNSQQLQLIPSKKHTTRAINIEHALSSNADKMVQVNFELPANTKQELEAIVYGRINHAVHEWKNNINDEKLATNVMNELRALSRRQQENALKQHQLNDCENGISNRAHLRLNLAINTWKAHNYNEDYKAPMNEEFAKFSSEELTTIGELHQMNIKQFPRS